MFSKILVTSLVLEGSSLFVSAFPEMAGRSLQRLEQRVGVPPLVEFPEYPGLPTHALYNKFDPATQLYVFFSNQS